MPHIFIKLILTDIDMNWIQESLFVKVGVPQNQVSKS